MREKEHNDARNNEALYANPETLELVYHHVEGVREQQGQISDAQGTKATALWAVASAMTGIVVPIGLVSKTTWNVWLWVSLALYGLCTVLAAIVIVPKAYHSVPNPATMELYRGQTKDQVMMKLIDVIKKYHSLNQKKLAFQGMSVLLLSFSVLATVATLVMWVRTAMA